MPLGNAGALSNHCGRAAISKTGENLPGHLWCCCCASADCQSAASAGFAAPSMEVADHCDETLKGSGTSFGPLHVDTMPFLEWA